MRISDWSSDVCSSDLLDQRIPGPDLPTQFATGDHRQRRPVLDRTRRVIPFELEQKRVAGNARQALQTNQRSVADAIGDSEVLHGHGVFAIRTAGAPIIPANLARPYHAKCGGYGLWE